MEEVHVPNLAPLDPRVPNLAALDPNDVLFLHHSDHPNYSLSTRLLNAGNYNHWRRAVEMPLVAKNKIGFIDGSCQAPSENSPLYLHWRRCNSMVISWILHSVEKDIVASLLYCTTVSEVWEDLKMRFGAPNSTRLYQKLLLNQQVMQFLVGLPDTYNNVRASILMIKPTSNISEVYRMILEEEQQRQLNNPPSVTGDGAAFNAFQRNASGQSNFGGKGGASTGANNGKGKPTYFCEHCKVQGHSISRCFKIHGYPPNFKNGGSDKPKKFAANVTTDEPGNQEVVPSFTKGQYEQIVALLGKQTSDHEAAGLAGPFHEHATSAW